MLIEYLIVGGGGSGGVADRSGGGGAGGEVKAGSFYAPLGEVINVTVGLGGVAVDSSPWNVFGVGGNSSIISTNVPEIIAYGGGNGGGFMNNGAIAQTPGYGGGAAHNQSVISNSGEGKTSGGAGYEGSGEEDLNYSGGGGGSGTLNDGGSVGGTGTISLAGIGAEGYSSNIEDGETIQVYGSGGGGGFETAQVPPYSYVASGGTNAGSGSVSDYNDNSSFIDAVSPEPNFGGGGGGGSGYNIRHNDNISGASGVVIFYNTSTNTRTKFTSDDTYTVG
jgi:hypothetical protein